METFSLIVYLLIGSHTQTFVVDTGLSYEDCIAAALEIESIQLDNDLKISEEDFLALSCKPE